MTVVQELDKTLFDGYVKPKAAIVTSIVRRGILDSDMDWYETPQPTGSSSCLPCLCEISVTDYQHRDTTVHVRNTDVPCRRSRSSQQRGRSTARSDIERTRGGPRAGSLAVFPSGQTLWYGWHAPGAYYLPLALLRLTLTFVIWSIAQATLEIEFMHQTLSRYVTASANATLSELYEKISKAYARRPGDENLQSLLDGVKRTLAETRRATGIEFLCFRVTKERSSTKDKEREKGGSGSISSVKERERKDSEYSTGSGSSRRNPEKTERVRKDMEIQRTERDRERSKKESERPAQREKESSGLH